MTENANTKRPTHTIYKVTGEGSNGRFMKVGAAFPHKDGKGLTLVFDAIPVNGRIQLRVNQERNAQTKAVQQPTQPELAM